jgi:uncharacterized protein YmfQ (DUF2313 family)
MTLFREHTQQEHTDALAQYLPSGVAWISKNIDGTDLRKLLLGLAGEILRSEQKINEISAEYFPQTTTQLLSEWEALLGIPDDCIQLETTADARRKNILLKLNASFIGTSADFIYLASLMGYVIRIKTSADMITFPLTFPIEMIDAGEEPYVWYIQFVGIVQQNALPLTFPITFTADPTDAIKCLFQKLKPANTKLFFRYISA